MTEFTLTDNNFEQEVLQSKIPVLVDFWAPWCIDPKANISLVDNFYTKAEKIKKGDEVLGWSKTISLGKVSHARVISDGGHCRLIKTTSDRRIKVTDDHLFYAPSGWKKASELKKGDKVAIFPLDGPVVFRGTKKVLISENDIKKIAFPKMRSALYIKELSEKGFLPLYQNDPKILFLVRLMGALFTDGNLYQGRNNLREVSFFLGSKKDVEAVARDLRAMGFSKIYINFRETEGQIGERKFINHSFRVKSLSTSLWLLLRALGVPNGSKTDQDYNLPEWLMKAPKAVKKEFLAAFLGGDGPKISIRLQERKKKGAYNKLSINDLEFHKSKPYSVSGVELANQLSSLFGEFGVKVSRIFTEEERFQRKDGSCSIAIHLQFSHDFINGLAMAKNIGYRYCFQKQISAMYAGEFLKIIEEKKKEWRELYKKVLIEAKNGFGYRRVSRKLGIPPLLAFNWIKGRDKATSPKHFLRFPAWFKEVTRGLKDGFIWGEISKIEPVFLPSVARVAVDKTNNFIANGFLVHNCGPCRTMCPVIEELAKEYDGKVKVGKINVEENSKTAAQYGIMSIPSLLIFKNGKPVKNIVGAQGKEVLKKEIEEVLLV